MITSDPHPNPWEELKPIQTTKG